MAPKGKTKTKNKKTQGYYPQKEANSSTLTWPDLPQKLVDIIARHPALMQHIWYGGVTKSCKASTSICNRNKSPPPACLQLFDRDHDQINNDNSDDKDYVRPFPNTAIYKCWFSQYCYYRRSNWPLVGGHDRDCVLAGYSNNALLLMNKSSHLMFFWYPEPNGFYGSHFLPDWDESIPLKRVVTSSSRVYYNKTYTSMVLTGISHPAFLFFRSASAEGEREWAMQDCSLTEPHGKNYMTFTNAIGFNDRFYALSLQGTLAVMDVTESYPPKITALSSVRAVPSVIPKYFREYLLESEGNVLLVLLNFRKSIKVVDDVEVFQLNKEKLSWVKMASLGDTILFLGITCSISVSASKVGCRRNCVYFVNVMADGWWVFDMAKGCISPGWTDATIKAPDWTEPPTEEEEELLFLPYISKVTRLD